MKQELTPIGWIQTTVERFVVKTVQAMPKQTVRHWIDFHSRNPQFRKSRTGASSCDRCKTSWDKVPCDQLIHICIMEKHVNKAVCEACAKEIQSTLDKHDL